MLDSRYPPISMNHRSVMILFYAIFKLLAWLLSGYIEFVVEVLAAGDSFFGIELGDFMAYIIDVVVVLISNGINMTGAKRKLWLNWVVSLASGAKMIIFYIVPVCLLSHMVERTKKPSKDIPIELMGLMSEIIVAYCFVVLALTMMVKYNEVDVHDVYLVVFEQMGEKICQVFG
ncbi:hypothetical protein V6N11_036808 [Hibiscus sabdariffa]|uniref:Uncharacterized protein n=1 Tax=Hibiscus sabdariffa TaxID=183260 RepID=A0ABR2RC87_9ROSI